MRIHKIVPYVDGYQWLKLLDTQLNKTTNKIRIKVYKVVEPMNNKTFWHDDFK